MVLLQKKNDRLLRLPQHCCKFLVVFWLVPLILHALASTFCCFQRHRLPPRPSTILAMCARNFYEFHSLIFFFFFLSLQGLYKRCPQQGEASRASEARCEIIWGKERNRRPKTKVWRVHHLRPETPGEDTETKVVPFKIRAKHIIQCKGSLKSPWRNQKSGL